MNVLNDKGETPAMIVNAAQRQKERTPPSSPQVDDNIGNED